MTILSALVLLGVLIFVHELGHFLFAKFMNVKVEKFSLGFGPKVFSKKVGETEYILSALPLGGFVKMLGEDPEDEEELSEADKKRAYNHQPVWKRLLIVVSGPVFNLLFAVLVFAVIFFSGVPHLLPEVGEVLDGSPAMKAGLMEGDRIVEIEGVEITVWLEMTDIIHQRPEEALDFRVERAGDVFGVSIVPERKSGKNVFGEEKEIGLIGIKPSGGEIVVKSGLARSMYLGVVRTAEISALTLEAFVKLIRRVIPVDNLGGPILILSMAGEQASRGAMSFFGFMAVISINLGLINLFPVPVLDGGHIVFLLIEAVRRRPLSEKTMIIAQKAGLAIIISLIAFAFYNDIARLLSGDKFP